VKSLAKILGCRGVLASARAKLAVGAPADVVLFDPGGKRAHLGRDAEEPGQNTPFLGYRARGRVRTTIVAGSVVYGQMSET